MARQVIQELFRLKLLIFVVPLHQDVITLKTTTIITTGITITTTRIPTIITTGTTITTTRIQTTITSITTIRTTIIPIQTTTTPITITTIAVPRLEVLLWLMPAEIQI